MYPNLKLQLFKTGMRQNRLAQSLGLDESILSKIINGFREPTEELRKKIASLLQSDAEWLFQRNELHNTSADGARAEQASTPLLQLRRSSEQA
jgi:transcriptional regulator with XRE-family HTH domain